MGHDVWSSDGDGRVQRDVTAAGALFRKACEGGLAHGCNNEAVLGVMTGGGEGGGKAAEALGTACAAGSSAACSNLAMLRAGVPLALRQQQGVSLFAVDCNDDVPLGCTHNSAASPEPPAGVPKDLAAAVAALRKAVLGTWTGTGTESTGRTWAMTVTLDNLESGRCGRAAFPSQNCAGDLYCTVSSDGKQIRAREVITSGQGKCDSTGEVAFTVSDDGQPADYKWTSPVRNEVPPPHLTRAAK